MADAAPYVTVHYWRHLPGGGSMGVDRGCGADFAIVQVPGLAALRLELPYERDKLDTFLAAVTIVYGLGHRDRVNRVRKLMCLAPVERVPNCSPVTFDHE